MVERKSNWLRRFLWQGLAGLALIVATMLAVSFLVGVLRWVVSLALLLAVGYVVWRVFKAVTT